MGSVPSGLGEFSSDCSSTPVCSVDCSSGCTGYPDPDPDHKSLPLPKRSNVGASVELPSGFSEM